MKTENDLKNVIENLLEITGTFTDLAKSAVNRNDDEIFYFKTEDFEDHELKKKLPLDAKILGLPTYLRDGLIEMTAHQPEKTLSSETYNIYWMECKKGDLFLDHEATRVENSLTLGYSASAWHVFGYSIKHNNYKLIDTIYKDDTLIELTASILAQSFFHLVLDIYGKEEYDTLFDTSMIELGDWFKTLPSYNVGQYFPNQRSEYYGVDLYLKNKKWIDIKRSERAT